VSPNELKHPLVAVADEHLDKTFERIDKAAEPLWQGQTESIKSIITLASSALVLSITVAQFLTGRTAHMHTTWLLPTAWALFVVSLVIGGGNFSWLAATRVGRARFELQRGGVRGKLRELDADEPGLAAKVDDILTEALNEAWVEVADRHKTYVWRFHIMYWSFVLGLIALVVFAVRNLPFPIVA
jgi:hypothetical protein